MQKTCSQCSSGFEISERFSAWLEKASPRFGEVKCLIPSPTLCPQCRQQRRLVWRNERTLYSRNCDQCKKSIIAAYPPDARFPVYCYTCWWSDENDATKHGKEFDFSRSFFEQFSALVAKIPRLNLSNSKNENSEYTNYTNSSKDCYLIFGNTEAEKCMYSWRVHNSLKCIDCAQMSHCRYCYSCVDCDNCYELFYSQNCQNCNSSSYLYNCRGLSDCFMCCNLFNKQYCIFNEQYTKEEYEKKVKELMADRVSAEKMFREFILKFPRKALQNINCENSRGDYLLNTRNCEDVFTAKECQDCQNVYLAEKAVDCVDCDIVGWPAEMCYECTSTCAGATSNYFSSLCWGSNSIFYCDSSFYCQNLFGCVGVKKKQYCILNKQYTKEEYEKLVPRIVEHMKTRGEWGEFFPVALSPFAYNETIAQEHYPLSEDEAHKNGFPWSSYQAPKIDAKEAVHCEVTGKPFRLVPAELEFYQQFGIPLPTKHPDVRHKERMALRNPKKIFQRNCMKCKKEILTSYAPEKSEIVYCEECYLKETY